MWDFLGVIVEQLSETFRWFLIGYFGTIALLILLYKNQLLNNSSPFGFIKKVSYYIFLPVYVAIVCWFLSATIIVEKDAKQMAEYSLNKVEDSTLTLFLKEAVTYSTDWIDGEITTKEELVNTYLKKNGYEMGSYSTQVVEWTLNNGLEYIKKQAIEKGTIRVGEESINFPLLIQEYLNESKGMASAPFSYLKGMTFKVIHSYAKKLYWLYVFLLFIVVLILGLDIYFKLRNRNNSKELSLNPEDLLENNQDKLPNSQRKINKK